MLFSMEIDKIFDELRLQAGVLLSASEILICITSACTLFHHEMLMPFYFFPQSELEKKAAKLFQDFKHFKTIARLKSARRG